MADRTVTVHLNAAVTRYLRNMKASEEQTARVTGKMRGLREEAVDVGVEAKKSGASFAEMGAHTNALSKKMFELEVAIRNTAKEIQRTGDLDLLKGLRKDQGQLRALTRISKEILGVGDNARKAGASLGADVLNSFTSAISRGGTTFVGAVVGAAALAAPPIGAALAAAVVGGSGALGIAGGIAMASRDARVKAAATHLGAVFMGEFGSATQSFTAPTIAALHQLELAAIDVAGNLRPEFAGLAAHVEPLAAALRGMVANTLPGFKKGLESGMVVLAALERALPELGEDLSDMFESFSENPEAAAAAMHDLLMIVGETAKAVGVLTHFLSSYYEVLIKVGAVTVGWANDMPMWIKQITPLAAVAGYFDQAEGAMRGAARSAPQLGAGLGSIIRAEEEVAEATKTATQKIEDQITAMDKMFGRLMDPLELASRYQEAVDDLTESVKENGTSLDINSEAGRRNQEAIRNAAEAIKEIRNNTIELTGDVEGANTVYYQQIEALRQQAIKLGMSEQAANEMAGALRDIPRQVDVEVRVPGLDEAIRKAQKLKNLFGSLAAGANVSGNYDYVSGRRWGGITVHAQSGMLRDAAMFSTRSPARYAFAEPGTGGEAFVPRFGDYRRSMSILEQAAGWYGASVMPQSHPKPMAAEGPRPTEVARAIKAALAGVAVVMDGRIVGHIQARQADMYTRGG